MSAEHKREGEASTAFTVVFDGDVRGLSFNPCTLETPFGKVRSVGVGDAHAINDDMFAALKTIASMQPTHIADGFVHGPALLLSNCQRVALSALAKATAAPPCP